jgi:hypothetical protein
MSEFNSLFIQPEIPDTPPEDSIKRGRGRPKTHDVKTVGAEYFRNYYQLNKTDTYNCLCGQVVKRLCRAKHNKSMHHQYNLYVQASKNGQSENI